MPVREEEGAEDGVGEERLKDDRHVARLTEVAKPSS